MTLTVVAVRPLLFKPHRLKCLSDFWSATTSTNCGGALRRLNAINGRLASLEAEQLIAAGSVILHEVYFDAIGGEGGDPPARPLARAIEHDFGSLAAWRAEFVAMAKAQCGGCGWTILSWSDRLGCLVNQWVADHAHGLPGGTPLLAIDMCEHSYHLDFGAQAETHVNQLMANLAWERVEARYLQAIGKSVDGPDLFLPAGAPTSEEARISVDEVRAAGDVVNRPLLLDVCLPTDIARRNDMILRATFHAPGGLGQWCEELPRDRPIAVYCTNGFQVSGETTEALRKWGL